MSHFVVMCIGANYKEQLAPYEETADGPYVVFTPTEEQLRKSYETETTNCFVDPKGIPHQMCSDEFRNPDVFDSSNRYICPAGWTEKKVPVKEVYTTWESYLTDYCGEEPDEQTGRLGYWSNPNAKWDWYVVGGRWSNWLRHKDGTKVDQARYGDIDWAAMLAGHVEFWTKVYDYVWPKIKDTPESLPWSDFYDRAEREEITFDQARTEWKNQPRIKIAEELAEIARRNQTKSDVDSWIGWDLNTEAHTFTADKAMFVKLRAEESLSTFAVVKDGRWFERGKMGWFAAVHDEKDPETWTAIWSSLTRDIDPDTLITIIDCHI